MFWGLPYLINVRKISMSTSGCSMSTRSGSMSTYGHPMSTRRGSMSTSRHSMSTRLHTDTIPPEKDKLNSPTAF